MEGRFLFDMTLWISIIFRAITLSIFLSLLYNFSKETAFEDEIQFDEMYVLTLGFVPVTSLLSLIMTFSTFFGFYYLYFLIVLIIGIIIVTNLIVKIAYYWRYSRRYNEELLMYKRSTLFTTFGCTTVIIFYECIFSFSKGNQV